MYTVYTEYDKEAFTYFFRNKYYIYFTDGKNKTRAIIRHILKEVFTPLCEGDDEKIKGLESYLENDETIKKEGYFIRKEFVKKYWTVNNEYRFDIHTKYSCATNYKEEDIIFLS